MATSILTICTGNICRSPIAEFILAERLPKINVSSAGLHALIGCDTDPLSAMAARNLGITVNEHTARQFTSHLAAAADIILVMDQGHLSEICQTCPDVYSKSFLLRKHRENPNVPDPYRLGIANHYRSVELILEGCTDWIEKLTS